MSYTYRQTYEPPSGRSLSQWHIVPATLVVCATGLLLGYRYSADHPAAGAAAMPLWGFLLGLMTDWGVAHIAGILILVITALLQQRINYHATLIRTSTKQPFLFFLLLCSTHMGFLPVTPASVAMLFFIPALSAFLKSEEPPESARVFNTTALIAAGSLIWIHLLWFVPLFWYGMYKFGFLGAKNLLASVVSVATVWTLVAGWCYWVQDYTALTVPAAQLADAGISFSQDLTSRFRWMCVAGIFLPTLFLSTYVRLQFFLGPLRVRKMFSFFFAFALYAFVLLVCFGKHYFTDFLYFFYMPVSLLLAVYFAHRQGGIITFLMYYGFLIMMFFFVLVQIWVV
ncbi:MAG: hypothetical protein LBP64_06625 [Tannerella sp.]|jgi:hypothetical protein|nr:hypothetical protein [Tannerella sp.]